MKTFITVADLNEYVSKGNRVIRLGEGDVLTAAAAEDAERLGITVEQGTPAADPKIGDAGKGGWVDIRERRINIPMTRGKKPTGCLGEKEYLIGESSSISGSSSSKANNSIDGDENLHSILGEIRNLLKSPGRT